MLTLAGARAAMSGVLLVDRLTAYIDETLAKVADEVVGRKARRKTYDIPLNVDGREFEELVNIHQFRRAWARAVSGG
jgi:hypothetical protein